MCVLPMHDTKLRRKFGDVVMLNAVNGMYVMSIVERYPSAYVDGSKL